jgi:hypothetical protein
LSGSGREVHGWKRTKLVEVTTQLKSVYVIHGAIYGSIYMSLSNSTTNISESGETVGHETPPYRILGTLSV